MGICGETGEVKVLMASHRQKVKFEVVETFLILLRNGLLSSAEFNAQKTCSKIWTGWLGSFARQNHYHVRGLALLCNSSDCPQELIGGEDHERGRTLPGTSSPSGKAYVPRRAQADCTIIPTTIARAWRPPRRLRFHFRLEWFR